MDESRKDVSAEISPRMMAVKEMVESLGRYTAHQEGGTDLQAIADILETAGKIVLEGMSVRVTLTHCGDPGGCGAYASSSI